VAPACVPVPQGLVDALSDAASAARAAVPSELRNAVRSDGGSGGQTPPAIPLTHTLTGSPADENHAVEQPLSPSQSLTSTSSSSDPNSEVVLLQWGDRTYFFRGEQYWRLHVSGCRMDAGYPL